MPDLEDDLAAALNRAPLDAALRVIEREVAHRTVHLHHQLTAAHAVIAQLRADLAAAEDAAAGITPRRIHLAIVQPTRFPTPGDAK